VIHVKTVRRPARGVRLKRSDGSLWAELRNSFLLHPDFGFMFTNPGERQYEYETPFEGSTELPQVD
jgi:hypothetical protein